MKSNNYLKVLLISALMTASFTLTGAVKPPELKEETISFTVNGVSYKCFVAYDDAVKTKRPAVLVIPEWWGLNDYTRMRTRKLAELGYIAMATDMFGDGRVAKDPTEAQSFTAAYYKDPALVKTVLDAAAAKLKSYPQADASKLGAIGYCFGGYVVLNYAKMGADLKGVVSFHGGLGGVAVDKSLLKAQVLICHGGADKFVSIKDAENLKHKLDSVGAVSTLKVYPGATHAFTNPDATATGKKFNMPIEYNAKADQDSWNDMKTFFTAVFSK